MAKVEDASSLRSTSVISERWLAGSACRLSPLQVLGDEVVEPVFALFRRELLHERKPLGVGDVRGDLPAQRAVADRLRAAPSASRTPAPESRLANCSRKLLQVAEGVLVDEADEAEQLQQRVLQRRRGEQQLVLAGQRQLERVGDDVGRACRRCAAGAPRR